MPAQLLALTDGPHILLDKPILLLGRHAECDIQLNSRKVSRRHCCIAQVSNYLVVRDLGSTNGIRINGVRVLEGRLKSGDELTIGNFRYEVTWDDKPQAPAKPAAAPAKGPAKAAPAAVPVPHSATDSDEDAILESCDDPVMLGQPPKKPAPAPDSSPKFPEDVDLLGNSDSQQNLGQQPNPSH
jgi:predicted component of type VI protein secretion system